MGEDAGRLVKRRQRMWVSAGSRSGRSDGVGDGLPVGIREDRGAVAPRRWWVRSRTIIYLLLGLVVVDIAVFSRRALWEAYDPEDYLERVNGCARQPCDLVVVGGSAVHEGINPAALAGLRWKGHTLERAYNLGLAGATASEVWHAVRRGLVVPPRLLVYGITASDLNDTRNEPHGPRVLMDLNDLAEWVATRPASAEWVTRHFIQGRLARLWNLFYYRTGIRLWAADVVERLKPGASPESAAEARDNLQYGAAISRSDGFAPRTWFRGRRLDQVKAAGELPTRFPFLERFRLGDHLRCLNQLLDWAELHGVTVVLVDMPVSADLEERMHPAAFDQYRSALAELERKRGVRVLWAARQAVGVGDADFADLVHLNAGGSGRLSAWLRRALEESVGSEGIIDEGPGREDPGEFRQ